MPVKACRVLNFHLPDAGVIWNTTPHWHEASPPSSATPNRFPALSTSNGPREPTAPSAPPVNECSTLCFQPPPLTGEIWYTTPQPPPLHFCRLPPSGVVP